MSSLPEDAAGEHKTVLRPWSHDGQQWLIADPELVSTGEQLAEAARAVRLRLDPVSTLPADHECTACGGRVESLVVDWADNDGRRLVVDETPSFCATCSSALAGRQVWREAQVEVSVEGIYGVRRLDVRANLT